MGTFWTVTGIFFALALFAGIMQSIGQSSKQKAQGQALALIPDFIPSVVLNGMSGGAGVAIDATRNKFAISNGPNHASVFNYSDLVSVEVLRNGSSVHQTNRGSQVAGAAVGALLLGPVGLLLGGLTGSKRSSEKINKLSLKIFTTDIVNPVHEIVFFNGPPSKPDGVLVTMASNELDAWHGRFQTIMRMGNLPQNSALT